MAFSLIRGQSPYYLAVDSDYDNRVGVSTNGAHDREFEYYEESRRLEQQHEQSPAGSLVGLILMRV